MYVFANPNPYKLITDDCVVRAISLAEQESWDDIFVGLMVQGYMEKEMPNANSVWGHYLIDRGYKRSNIPNTCPDCYTLSQFCSEHPHGTYVVGTGTHAVCVIEGDWYDIFNSADTVPLYYFTKEE